MARPLQRSNPMNPRRTDPQTPAAIASYATRYSFVATDADRPTAPPPEPEAAAIAAFERDINDLGEPAARLKNLADATGKCYRRIP